MTGSLSSRSLSDLDSSSDQGFLFFTFLAETPLGVGGFLTLGAPEQQETGRRVRALPSDREFPIIWCSGIDLAPSSPSWLVELWVWLQSSLQFLRRRHHQTPTSQLHPSRPDNKTACDRPGRQMFLRLHDNTSVVTFFFLISFLAASDLIGWVGGSTLRPNGEGSVSSRFIFFTLGFPTLPFTSLMAFPAFCSSLSWLSTFCPGKNRK